MADEVAPEPEILTEIPKQFISEYWDHIIGRVPQEKIDCELRQLRAQRVMQQAGSVNIEGVGQKIAEIDPRLWFRMQHSFGHHEGWIDDMLADNPQLCAPGYKPRRRKNDLRHSLTMVGGKPA